MNGPIYLVFRTSNEPSARAIQDHCMMLGAQGKAFTIEGLTRTCHEELEDLGVPTEAQWMESTHG